MTVLPALRAEPTPHGILLASKRTFEIDALVWAVDLTSDVTPSIDENTEFVAPSLLSSSALTCPYSTDRCLRSAPSWHMPLHSSSMADARLTRALLASTKFDTSATVDRSDRRRRKLRITVLSAQEAEMTRKTSMVDKQRPFGAFMVGFMMVW
jgi:hypothetical protein